MVAEMTVTAAKVQGGYDYEVRIDGELAGWMRYRSQASKWWYRYVTEDDFRGLPSVYRRDVAEGAIRQRWMHEKGLTP